MLPSVLQETMAVPGAQGKARGTDRGPKGEIPRSPEALQLLPLLPELMPWAHVARTCPCEGEGKRICIQSRSMVVSLSIWRSSKARIA